jgi:hypothetical protein
MCQAIGIVEHYLRDLIDSFALHQLVTKPTRITPTTQTLLDPLIVGNPQLVQSISVLPPSCSDQSPVMATFLLPTRRNSYKRKIIKPTGRPAGCVQTRNTHY